MNLRNDTFFSNEELSDILGAGGDEPEEGVGDDEPRASVSCNEQLASSEVE